MPTTTFPTATTDLDDPEAVTAEGRLAALADIFARGLGRIPCPSGGLDGVAHSMRIVGEVPDTGLEHVGSSCPDGGTVNAQRKDVPC